MVEASVAEGASVARGLSSRPPWTAHFPADPAAAPAAPRRRSAAPFPACRRANPLACRACSSTLRSAADCLVCLSGPRCAAAYSPALKCVAKRESKRSHGWGGWSAKRRPSVRPDASSGAPQASPTQGAELDQAPDCCGAQGQQRQRGEGQDAARGRSPWGCGHGGAVDVGKHAAACPTRVTSSWQWRDGPRSAPAVAPDASARLCSEPA